jgi:SAM-dependent MidA family methyltransferase
VCGTRVPARPVAVHSLCGTSRQTPGMSQDPAPWREAWERALYGPAGFWLREAPRDHFRTSVTASPLLAGAVRRLAGRVDEALGRPDPFDVVDLGAGRAELLLALPDVPARWRLTAVERAPDPGVGVLWRHAVPPVTGLLLAHELLDSVPLDVVRDGRLVVVDEAGSEAAGPDATAEALDWVARWWPAPGRAEVGRSRDRTWAAAVAAVGRGLAVAVDYGHDRATRRPTLTGYRAGRQVPPVPDGSCDLTAHVALDSAAAATGSRLLRQREVLQDLGVSGAVPPWCGDAAAYAAALQQASQARSLLDPAGPGGFGWLVRAVGVPDPLAAVAGPRPATMPA